MVGREDREVSRRQLRDFLASRRARVSPTDAGLPAGIGARRVPGLRREEVALLAGISVEYYAKLERGTAIGVSDGVLDAIARVLRLDDVEEDHLHELFRSAGGRPGGVVPQPETVPDSIRRTLLLISRAAAFVRNDRLDVLAANPLARRLYADLFEDEADAPNLARYVFLDPRSRLLYDDWDGVAWAAAGSLRVLSARQPGDARLAELVDGLRRGSAEFRKRWRAHDVEDYRGGRQVFRHPAAGELALNYDAFEVAAHPGLTMLVYSAPEGSAAQDTLDALTVGD